MLGLPNRFDLKAGPAGLRLAKPEPCGGKQGGTGGFLAT